MPTHYKEGKTLRMIIAMVQDQEVNTLLGALTEKGYTATKLASTGGFLRQGNTTLLIGTEEAKVDQAVGIIKEICKTKKRLYTPVAGIERTINSYIPSPIEVEVGGATIFVLKVESLAKI